MIRVTAIREDAVDAFRACLSAQLGFRFEDDDENRVETVLRDRVTATGCRDVDEYLARLENPDAGRKEIRRLVRAFSMGATGFFQDQRQLRAFRDALLPELVRRTRRDEPIRILSAGCATGEEVYSLALLIREQEERLAGRTVNLVGIDVNEYAIETARAGRYPPWSLRQVNEAAVGSWFRREGSLFVVGETGRRGVEFQVRNLLDPDADFWRPDSFHVVFCRNVLSYLTVEAARDVVDRVAGAIAPCGFLFLGRAETLRGLTRDFHVRHHGESFFYERRRERGGRTAPQAGGASSGESAPVSPSMPTSARGVPGAAPSSRLGPALAAIQEEEYDDALSHLDALPSPAREDSDTRLLRSLALINRAEYAEAEKELRSLLGHDDLHPAGHYLLAICREQRGDPMNAAEHHRVAAHLDPGFSLPRMQLGWLALRRGDVVAGRREMRNALELLPQEDEVRVLLYGGGLGRETLMELCRAELRLLGERT